MEKFLVNLYQKLTSSEVAFLAKKESYEDLATKLQNILNELENEQLNLDESMKAYEDGVVYPAHNSKYIMDDSLLCNGVKMFIKTAIDYLNE